MSVDPWPAVGVGTTDRAITAYGGAVLLRDLMSTLRVLGTLDDCVAVKVRQRGLSEGEFIAAMAESVALGATCLDDLAVARGDAAQEELRGTPCYVGSTRSSGDDAWSGSGADRAGRAS